MISDAVSACDSFNKFILGIAVLKCFDHFGSQPDDDNAEDQSDKEILTS